MPSVPRATTRVVASALLVALVVGVALVDPFDGDGGRTAAAPPASTAPSTVVDPTVDATTALATTTTSPPPVPPKATARTPSPVPGYVVAAHVTAASIDVFDLPGGEARVTLANPRPTGAPLVLQVVDDRGGWLAVRAPTRPNGFVGWVRAEGLSFTTSDVRIVVDVGDLTVSAFRGLELLGSVPGAVGRPATPTPLGTFYVTEIHDLRAQHSVYGTFALGLSAFSETLATFNGGDAQTAIHGTWATDSVGRVVSNGCVRLHNADIEWLASIAPVGTPVEIVA